MLVTSMVPRKGSGKVKMPGEITRGLDYPNPLAADKGPLGDEPRRKEQLGARRTLKRDLETRVRISWGIQGWCKRAEI